MKNKGFDVISQLTLLLQNLLGKFCKIITDFNIDELNRKKIFDNTN